MTSTGNPYHEPAGSSKGGQFAKAPGDGSIAGNAARKAAGLPDIPQAVIDRRLKDVATDGLSWRLREKKKGQIERPKNVETSIADLDRQGNCYYYAADFVIRNEGWELVHADIFPMYGPFMDTSYAHAFAMKDDVVYEPTFNKFFTKSAYFKLMVPINMRIYDRKKMYKWMLKTETYGNWE